MERLRAPGGCPWDREQTHLSIKPYLLEEAFEVAEAIEDEDIDELKTELGDLLLQIVFHAEMGREAGTFDIEDVVRGIIAKMVRRHPHVFGDAKVKDSEEVLDNWARIKQQERQHKEDNSIVSGVPRAMPALLRAHRLGEKASRVGFDWQRPLEVLEKVREELDELQAAVEGGARGEIEAELGDVVFALTSFGRHLGIQAEDAVLRTCDRFVARFKHIEKRLLETGRDIHTASIDEMEALWEDAKGQE